VACRLTTTSGLRWATMSGTGGRCCRTSVAWRTTRKGATSSTVAAARSRSAAGGGRMDSDAAGLLRCLPPPRLSRGRGPQSPRSDRRPSLPAEPARPPARVHRARLPPPGARPAEPHDPSTLSRHPDSVRRPGGSRCRTGRWRAAGAVYGRRITLAAGAVGSPAILLRSGIGESAALHELGIEPLVDVPAVGASLSDPPVTRLLLVPKRGSCDFETPLAQVVLRYTAPGSDEFNDMQQVIFSHVDCRSHRRRTGGGAGRYPAYDWPPGGARTAARTGRLSLSSSGPGVPPVIELNFAADPEDLRRLVEGIRLAWQIAREPSSRATLNVLPC
jgi:hypothetical protein